MNILVVEDDLGIRDMLRECLSDEGYTVQTAGDGQHGLDLLRASVTAPDLILLDIAMPVMSGWEFLAALRSDPRLAATPTVVFSADSNATRQQALGGATPVLTKPIDLEDLLSLVASYRPSE